MKEYSGIYEEVILHEFPIEANNAEEAEPEFERMKENGELDYSDGTLVEGKLVRIVDPNGHAKKVDDSWADLAEKANDPSTVRIPLGDGNTLVAERSSDPDIKEMYVYIENSEGVVWQDLVVVREKYELSDTDEDGEDIAPIHGMYEVLLYSNPGSEDYVGSPIEIPLYKED